MTKFDYLKYFNPLTFNFCLISSPPLQQDPSFAEMDIQSDYFEESVKIHLDVMDNTPHNGWWEDWWVEVVLLGVGVGLLLVVLLVVGGVWVVRRRKGSDYEVVEE